MRTFQRGLVLGLTAVLVLCGCQPRQPVYDPPPVPTPGPTPVPTPTPSPRPTPAPTDAVPVQVALDLGTALAGGKVMSLADTDAALGKRFDDRTQPVPPRDRVVLYVAKYTDGTKVNVWVHQNTAGRLVSIEVR